MASIIHIDVDTSGLKLDAVAAALHGDKLGLFAAAEWHRLYSKYVPEDTGTMRSTVNIEPWTITHTSPYAHYQYVGRVMGPSYPINNGETFRSPKGKPKHYTGGSLRYKKALATSQWDQRAAQTEGHKLADAIQAFIRKGDI